MAIERSASISGPSPFKVSCGGSATFATFDLRTGIGAVATGARTGVVLLVEDDNEVSALTREMLSSLGFSVIHVTNPAAALGALAGARAVDVVLSDIMMPGGMSGLELAREIRRRYPHLPVVLTTGYADAASGMQAGEFKLLLKPYSTAALAEALQVGQRHPA